MDGIRFGTGNSLTEKNTTSNAGYGLRSTWAINRIDSNSAANSGIGILCGNDYLVRNTFFVNVGVSTHARPISSVCSDAAASCEQGGMNS